VSAVETCAFPIIRFGGEVVFGGRNVTGARKILIAASLMPFVYMTGSGAAFAAAAFAFGQKPGPSGWSSGSAYNHKTPDDAQSTALSRCHSRREAGSYCKVITTFNGKCFAIAVQDSGNGYGWNTAETKPEAERLAMNRCGGYGKSCTISESFCDTINTSTAAPPAAVPEPAPAPNRAIPPATSPGGSGSPACQKFPDLC
jgi:hypothetical protein